MRTMLSTLLSLALLCVGIGLAITVAMGEQEVVNMPYRTEEIWCENGSSRIYGIAYMFPLSHKREDTFLAGLSMGGFGACRNALKYWDTFGKAAILSGALHIYEYPVEWVETQGNTIGEVRNFGNPEETKNTDRNPRTLIQSIQSDPARQFPAFYIACGLQDHLLEANRSIAKALTDAGADVTYEEGEGIHDWYFWNEYIQHVLKWLDYKAARKK